MFYYATMSRVPDAHRLFFALMPPAGLRSELARLRDVTSQGKAEADERLHVTMFLFDHAPEFQADIAGRIAVALDGQALPKCRVLFEQLVRGKGSTLLLPNEKLDGVVRLQARLAGLLENHCLHPASYWRFKPHMTLRRGKAEGETLAIDAVSWVAEELILLDSHIGLTHYEEVGRWPLMEMAR